MTARAAEMVALRRAGLTLAEIGDRFGLTRERVRQIVSPYVDRHEARAARRSVVLSSDLNVYGARVAEMIAAGAPKCDIVADIGIPWERVDAVVTHLELQPAARDIARFHNCRGPRRYSEADFLDALRRCGDHLGRTPSVAGYTRWRREHEPTAPYSLTISNAFGRWNDALAAAGFDDIRTTHGRLGRRRFSDADLLEVVHGVAVAIGCFPTERQVAAAATSPGVECIRQRFGTWSGVRVAYEDWLP